MHPRDIVDYVNQTTNIEIIERHLDNAFTSIERAVTAKKNLTLLACLDGAISEAIKAKQMIDFECRYLNEAIAYAESVRDPLREGKVYHTANVAEAGGNIAAAKSSIRLRLTVAARTQSAE